MPDNRKTIAHTIRRLRHGAGMTQVELGEKLGFTGMYISVLESGRICPSFPTAINIARVFGITLDALTEDWI